MKFKILILLTIILTAGFSGVRAEDYTIEIGQFDKIKVNSNINVVYKCSTDSTGYASYSGDKGLDNIFFLNVKKDGTLKIQLADAFWGKKDIPVLYVYSDFLSSVENSSDMTVRVENLVPCASFNANQIGNGSILAENIKCNNVSAAVTTGNGSVNLSGKCVNANFRMVGAGLISADRLQAENVKCTILGTGSIGCWAIDNLNVKGLGTTKIYYKGKPNIKKTGGGKLFELPEEALEENYEEVAKVVSFDEPVEMLPDDEDGNQEDGTADNDDEEDEDEDDDEEEDENYQTVVTADD